MFDSLLHGKFISKLSNVGFNSKVLDSIHLLKCPQVVKINDLLSQTKISHFGTVQGPGTVCSAYNICKRHIHAKAKR